VKGCWHALACDAVGIVSVCPRMPMSTGITTRLSTPRLFRAAQWAKGPIMDVGCGDGLLLSKFALTGERVIGLDPDDVAASAARQRCAAFTNVEIRHPGFLDSPLDEDAFAVITGVAVLHHMDFRSAMERAARLLRPGGVLYFVGVPRLETPADFLWATSQWPRARIIGRLRDEYYPHGISTAPSDLSLGDIRTLAREVLPGALVRRAPYYRYSLRWTRPK
jgi:SAM-dependent methyltransferase